ncbi:MAG: hypothetical protein QXZ20_01525, partial [Candidatus Aenigmatarchaeota archaeon]
DGAEFTITAGDLANILAHNDSILNKITTGNDFIFRATNGDITILSGIVTSNFGSVSINSDLGSIYAFGSGLHIVAQDAVLSAPNGVVGTILNYPNPGYGPINVDIAKTLTIIAGKASLPLVDGSITVYNSGSFWPVSANIVGTVGGSTVYTGKYPGDPNANIVIQPATSLFPLALIFNPAGYVFFNGIEIWPNLPKPTTGISQDMLNQLNSATGLRSLYYEILASFRLISIDMATPLFFAYHPLTPTDFTAFDGIVLDIGAYEFIENNLNIRDRSRLYPFYEEDEQKKKRKPNL